MPVPSSRLLLLDREIVLGWGIGRFVRPLKECFDLVDFERVGEEEALAEVALFALETP